jgi:hypothetical protein
MTCADYDRHEHLLDCAHYQAGRQVQVQMTDGCSARMCQDCFDRLGVQHWPGLAEAIGGGERGLDALQVARIIARERGPDG